MKFSAREIARICGGEKKTGNGYDCKCPAHEDKKASLSISEDGLIFCHAGCDYQAISSALKSRGFSLNGDSTPHQTIFYTYFDADNKPAFRKVKILPQKKFYIESYKNGAWVKGLQGSRILYRLPDLREAIQKNKPVCIAEGEKDCDSVLNTYGTLCTCNVAGAGHWLPEYNQEFKGANVTIFYDNDAPGIARKEQIIKSLQGVAKKITVIHIPKDYKDISDFIAAKRPLGELKSELIEAPKSLLFNGRKWLEESHYQIEVLMENLFDCGSKVAIIGKSKSRKSFFALQFMLSCATGRPFLGMNIPQPKRALIIQFEIQEAHFWWRLKRMCDAMDILPRDLDHNLSIVNARGQSLSNEKILEFIKESKAEIVLFDPLYKMMPLGENAAEEMKPILKWFDEIAKETKATVVYVHHDKKGFVAEQDITDRGAGSGVMGRDFDAAMLLTPHKTDGLTGLETISRNYPPIEAQTLQWQDGCFLQTNIPMQAKTSRTAALEKNRTVLSDWEGPAISNLDPDKFIPVSEFIQKLRDLGASRDMARAVMEKLVSTGKAMFDFRKPEKGVPGKAIKLITP